MLEGRDDTAKTGTKPSEEEEQVRLVVGKVNGCRETQAIFRSPESLYTRGVPSTNKVRDIPGRDSVLPQCGLLTRQRKLRLR